MIPSRYAVSYMGRCLKIAPPSCIGIKLSSDAQVFRYDGKCFSLIRQSRPRPCPRARARQRAGKRRRSFTQGSSSLTALRRCVPAVPYPFHDPLWKTTSMRRLHRGWHRTPWRILVLCPDIVICRLPSAFQLPPRCFGGIDTDARFSSSARKKYPLATCGSAMLPMQ